MYWFTTPPVSQQPGGSIMNNNRTVCDSYIQRCFDKDMNALVPLCVKDVNPLHLGDFSPNPLPESTM